MTAVESVDALVGAAFLRHEATHTRSQQAAPGVSLTYVCQRQAAYRYAGAPYTDPADGTDEKRAAAMGTWLHAGLLPQLRRSVGGRARFEVDVALELPNGRSLGGSVDLWLPKVAGGTTVDLKTCTESKLSRVRQHGAERHHLAAGHVYAAGLEATLGAKVERVAVVYLDRARGDHVTVDVPLDQDLKADALDWWDSAARYADTGPDSAPIGDRRGPGLDVVCDSCPFRSRCWPGVPGRDPQTALVVQGAVMIEDALATLADATERKAAAEADAAWAKALLDDVQPGTYGPWLWKRNRDTPAKDVPDVDAMQARLEALGEPIPVKQAGARKGARTVVRVAPDLPDPCNGLHTLRGDQTDLRCQVCGRV